MVRIWGSVRVTVRYGRADVRNGDLRGQVFGVQMLGRRGQMSNT